MNEKKLTDEAINATVKSLKWVRNQIPNDLGNSNEEKMLKAIQLYCQQGIAVIERLQGENADLKRLVNSLEEVKATLLENRKVQKEENEWLIEERQSLVTKLNQTDEAVDYWCDKFKAEKGKNTELQKQVDELKARDMSEMRDLFKAETDRLIEKAKQQAVKDTAKEIFTELLDFVNGWFEGVENNDFSVEFNRKLKDLSEKYGVEVE